MQFTALRSLRQPCMTAYCIHHTTYDPGVSPGSANQCVPGDVYLRCTLSRKWICRILQCLAVWVRTIKLILGLLDIPSMTANDMSVQQ